MISLRSSVSIFTAVLLLAAGSSLAYAATIQQQIAAKYALTKSTADRTDIVTAGDVIVLQKDHLFMCATTSALPSNNTYKDGRIQQSIFNKAKFFTAAGNTPTVPTRTFVTGEKFWLTNVEMKDDGVVLSFLSDAIGDNRFYGSLKFPFPKGSTPPPEQILNAIAEVIKAQPSDDAKADGGANQAPAAPAPPTMAAIPPPPPPPDATPAAPPTIALGQTKEQVTAMLGAPKKIAKLNTKEIDYFTDMKVTFVNNKVTNIE
jgi:hypothetical protein